jgi:hypothetical protein
MSTLPGVANDVSASSIEVGSFSAAMLMGVLGMLPVIGLDVMKNSIS